SDADLDHDQKLDPAGYEVGTGGTPIYLSADHRWIHASADDVLINVAQFVYFRGGLSIDIGSHEFVTVQTGIPQSIADLAAGGADAVNQALTLLSTKLAKLREDVKAEIEGAINGIKDEINAQVESIIDTIVAKLNSTLTDAIGAVTSDLKDQLTQV